MAFQDHTARACPLAPKEPISESSSPGGDVPLHPTGTAPERRFNDEYQRATTELAIAVIEALLRSHRQARQARAEGRSSAPLPLDAVQRFGLETALELLHHHVDTLVPE
jgi:hypothetical protein